MSAEELKKKHERAKFYANTTLQMAALFGVAAVIFTAAYDYFVCWQGTWRVIVALPVALLAFGVFRCALYLYETALDTIFDGPSERPSGFVWRIWFLAAPIVVGVLQFSIIDVVFHSFRASYDAPVCEANLPTSELVESN
ncbi:MAG: hypothetical protein JXQ85_05140 [Cognatishimia sp.]|uniref:hypothetical protein n=1 Tax=Cognatishimia sp. TaxID=2211648 RepID=UPI003B8E88C7